MKYADFLKRNSFDFEELLSFSYGNLVEDPPEGFSARLPSPPFLMMDRITLIEGCGRTGKIRAELDVRLDAWYFQCHFSADPVKPGCLSVDAIWQLLGFFCVWRGSLGSGRALGSGEISFNGQIRPYNKCVRYEIDIRRYSQLSESGASIVIGDGWIFVDELIAEMNQARTGVFKGISYPNYLKRSPNSIGGIMRSAI